MHLMHKGGEILNADIQNASVYCALSDSSQMVVKLVFIQEGEMIELPLIPVGDLGTLDLNRLDPRLLCLNKDLIATDRLVSAYIRQEVAAEIRAGHTGILFDRMGWETLPYGQRVFVAGNRVIGDLGKIEYIISPQVASVTLPDQTERSDREVVRDFLDRVARAPNVLIPLVAQSFRSALGSPFEEAGYPIRHVMELVGGQGNGKTTAVMDFAQPFVNERGEPANAARALSTKAAVRDYLANRRDVAVLLDDVCTSSDPETKRKSLAAAAFTLRFAADGIPQIIKEGKKTKQIRNAVGVIITGEFPMAVPSDVTRCAVVAVSEQMKGRQPDDRLVAAAALSRFLLFFAADYDRLVKSIRDTLSGFDPCAAEDSGPRQQRILAELSVAFQLFLDFALEIDAVSEKQYRKWLKKTEKGFEMALSINNELLAEYERRNCGNIARIIKEAVRTGTIRLADSREEYQQNGEVFNGFKAERKRRMIKLAAIAEVLAEASGHPCTLSHAGTLLRMEGLVEVGQENHTAGAKFPKMGRFVSLDWEVVKALAKKNC